MGLGAQIAGAVAAAVVVVLAVVFTVTARALRAKMIRARAELEAEGVVRDSGRCRATIRYRGYRAPGLYAGRAIRLGTRQLVLTRQSFVLLGHRPPRIPLAELGRYRVAAVDGALVFGSDDPFGASGHFELRMPLADVDAWVAALRAAGAAAA